MIMIFTTILLLGSAAIPLASAWGGLFSRFSPEILSNMGYGGHSSFRAQPFFQNSGEIESFQDLQEVSDEDPCYERRCTSNEDCCHSQVCFINPENVGVCVFVYGLRMGELCRRDSDCETGLLCVNSGEGRTCQPPMASRKQYNEDCTMSSECDIHRGLCCQFQRRHRQTPRKVCSYFKDPLVCIGPVASDQVKFADLERTAGEKRLTAKSIASGYNHLRR